MSSRPLLTEITLQCVSTDTVDLKHGGQSNVYFNMRKLLRNPQLFIRVAGELSTKIDQWRYDAICGAGGIADVLAGHISVALSIPQIIVRETVKTRGMERDIIGWDESYNNILMVDDVLTTGNTLAKYMDRIGMNKTYTVLVIVNRSNPYIGNVLSHPVVSLYTLYDFRNFFTMEEMIRWNITRKQSNICFSADIPDAFTIYTMIDDIKDQIFAVKLHPDIIDNFDWEVMCKVADKYGLLLIADLKLADVPHIVERQLAQVSAADMVTIHSFIDIPADRKGLILVANMSTGWEAQFDMGKIQHNNICGIVTQRRLNTNKIHFTPGNLSADTDVLIVGRQIYSAWSPYTAALELKNKYYKK